MDSKILEGCENNTKIKTPILITGVPRSRTSMVAGIFDICGAWGGMTVGPNSTNPKGMFENKHFRLINKRYLKRIGCDEFGQRPLPKPEQIDLSLADEYLNEIERKLKYQCYPGGPWYYKGAKMALVWQLWHKMFPRATWIIVRRDIDGIVDSCMRTDFMKAYDKKYQWRDWVLDYNNYIRDAKKHVYYFEIDTDRIIDREFGEIRFVVEKLGLIWEQEKVKEFLI